VGLTSVSDALTINVYDPNLPAINSIDCQIDSVWQECRLAQYGDNLQQIRIDATDLQGTPSVWLTLRNIPDDYNFVDNEVTYSGGYFTYNTNLTIADSGEWQIKVTAADSNDNIDTETITWNIPWGGLDCYLVSPTSNITAPKSGTFSVQAGVQCLDAECPDVNFSLLLNKPRELIYDDYTAESYGDIGSTDWYLAVKFTPSSYPAQLKMARFYIWDKTAYPFELNIWDDNGPTGTPGTNLVTPFVVDPVVTSEPCDVAWFDVDLSDYNIVINSGEFYIGWRQLEGTQNNQVGFDMEGTPYVAHTRSWAYASNPLTFVEEWFNLDDICRFCEIYPWMCDEFFCSIFPNICEGEYCGNLMIRAVMSEPGAYSGELPTSIGPAVLYTADDHPEPCPNQDMDPGQNCQVTLNVHAVGPAGQSTKFHVSAANKYSADNAGPIKVTITAPLSPCDAANLDAIFPVDGRDLVVLADQWLETEPPLFADIYLDGSVNFKDMAHLAEYWLQSCD
jgi:hypothetical protein